MKQTDLSDLRGQIFDLAKGSPVSERLKNVVVEANEGADGSEFLRVEVLLTNLDNLKFHEVEPLIKSIEDAVALVDERFPSVRFADAA